MFDAAIQDLEAKLDALDRSAAVGPKRATDFTNPSVPTVLRTTGVVP